MPRFPVVAAFGALVASISVFGACYGATEVAVVLTTDVGCEEKLMTAVYKGRPGGGYDNSATALTEECTPTGQEGTEAEIGTLVFVPRGARDAEVAIKVVMALGEIHPDECAADPREKPCIVATRSFAFVEHASLRIPIKLWGACQGVVCGEGETCSEGGQCVSDHIACGEDGCEIPEERSGPGGRERDAGPDGNTNDPPAQPICDPEGGARVLHTRDHEPSFFAVGNTQLVYASGDGVVSIDKTGVVKKVPLGRQITSLAARGASWAAGTTEEGVFLNGTPPLPALLGPNAPDVTSVAILPKGDGVHAFVRISEDKSKILSYVGGSGHVTHLEGDRDQIALGDSTLYVFDRTAITAYPIEDGRPDLKQATSLFVNKLVEGGARVFATSTTGDITSAKPGEVIAAFEKPPADTDKTRPMEIHRLPRAGESPDEKAIISFTTLATLPVPALAADSEFVYWTQGPTIRAVSNAADGRGAKATTVDIPDLLPYLGVDDACIYYWRKSVSTASDKFELWSAPKKNFQP